MKANLSNPVLMKEIKLRFRSPKSFVGILFYLAAMSLFVIGFIYLMTQDGSSGGYLDPGQSYLLFTMLTYIQLVLVLFITPGLTAGAISSEREKQTLNMLLTTSQTSFQIIIGKLLSSIAFLVLMLVSSLPLYSIVFLYGGVSPKQLLQLLFYFLLTTVAIGSLGVMFSTLIRKTIISMIATYGSVLALLAVTGFLSVFFAVLSQGGASPAAHLFAAINPAVLTASLLAPDSGGFLHEVTNLRWPIWLIYLLFYLVVTATSVFVSVKSLRVNMARGK
ncbi:ABC transporter permease [Bhargavaea beijingensis]|uniref:ABC transporter permease n=1 Tax=Bhargavaea beijingensis TaxID=426756 RepID=A0A1G7BLQ3_9BACL|nr:ABC transporter permease [Bhargavaea beijingensis]MCW1926777.1 ABC transporter permease [Bhargavaea beijingensis]RSK36973.1 ABC transporter permease [Bhargavaea beijingensis]SDE27873.1 ABC-2 family transporter protein [Bhargavaea beijingensis]